MKKRRRPELKIGTHYMLIDGKKVEIDPLKTDLPDRCKLTLAEIITGLKFELVDPPSES